jgi:hypothetical protein
LLAVGLGPPVVHPSVWGGIESLDPCLSPFININSKWIKDLNVRPETLKRPQERTGKTREHIGIGNNFLNRTPIVQQLRKRIDKWDCTKLKSFGTVKKIVTRPKRQPTKWRKIVTSYTSDKGLITRLYRELKKLNSQRINNPMIKWANELNRHFSKEEVQMANKHMNKCSASLAVKETQIKTTLIFHFTLVRMPIIKNTQKTKCWRGCGRQG